MTAPDRYGHTRIYRKGIETNEYIEGKRPLIEYNYSENDGASFLFRGPERCMEIHISNHATLQDLETLVETNIHPRIREEIQKMVDKGTITRYLDISLEE